MTAEFFLGADVGGTGVKYAITDLTERVIHRGEIGTDPNSGKRTLGRLAIEVAEKIGLTGPADGRSPLKRLAAVGLACAGIVDVRSGELSRSPNLPGWEGTNLRRIMGNEFGDCPVAVANDVNSALYGEFKAGAGRGCDDLVMIALGTGVGGGVLLNGNLVVGKRGGGGEIGHMVLDPAGPVCSCGNVGCLEAWAGSVAIRKRARELADVEHGGTALSRLMAAKREDANGDGVNGDDANSDDANGADADSDGLMGDDLTVRDLAQLAEQGDEACLALFTEVGHRLGQAVGNLLNVLDPDKVIIGGGVAQAGELIFGPCRLQALSLVLSPAVKETPIVPAELGPLAAAVGAAALAREEVMG